MEQAQGTPAMVTELKQQVRFLEETVMRLNVELSRYQAKINELETELRLARESESLLKARLKEAARPSQSHVHSHHAHLSHINRGEDDAELRERLELLKEENDILLEQQQITQQEMDQLRKHLQQLSSAGRDREDAQMKASVAQAKQTALEKEKEGLEEQLARKRSDLASQTAAAVNYKKSFDDLVTQKDHLVKENADLLARERSIVGLNAALEQDVKNLREYQRQAEHERESLSKEREDLFNQLVNLERRYSECEQREHSAVQGLQRAIAVAEESKLQKEQAAIKEQQISKELSRLTERLAILPNELRDHYTKEIEDHRAQHKAQLNRAQEEIRALVAEQGDLKALLDRVIRDKRAIEAEVSRMQREPHQEMERYQGEISRAQALSLSLQNERDALATQLEGLAASELTARRALEKERTQAVLQTEEAIRKVKRLETDHIIAVEERHKLKQQLEALHKANQDLITDKNTHVKTLSQEIASLTKGHETELAEFTKQIEELTESRQHAEQIHQGLLDEQHRMREKWREETKASALRFERIVQDQRSENEQLRERADDLASRLTSALTDNEQLSREHGDTFNILKQLRSQINMAEHHLNEVLVREQSIRNDNSALVAQIEHLTLKHSHHRHHLSREVSDRKDDDTLYKIQLDTANKEIETLQEHVASLKADKRKLMRKLQFIKKGVIEKLMPRTDEE